MPPPIAWTTSETTSAMMKTILKAVPDSQLFCGATCAITRPPAQYKEAE